MKCDTELNELTKNKIKNSKQKLGDKTKTNVGYRGQQNRTVRNLKKRRLGKSSKTTYANTTELIGLNTDHLDSSDVKQDLRTSFCDK